MQNLHLIVKSTIDSIMQIPKTFILDSMTLKPLFGKGFPKFGYQIKQVLQVFQQNGPLLIQLTTRVQQLNMLQEFRDNFARAIYRGHIPTILSKFANLKLLYRLLFIYVESLTNVYIKVNQKDQRDQKSQKINKLKQLGKILSLKGKHLQDWVNDTIQDPIMYLENLVYNIQDCMKAVSKQKFKHDKKMNAQLLQRLKPKIIKIAHKLQISISSLEKQITDYSLNYLHHIAYHNQVGWIKKRTKFYKILLYDVVKRNRMNFTYDRKFKYVTYRQMRNAIYIYISMNLASYNIFKPLRELGIRIQQYLAPIPYVSLPSDYNDEQKLLIVIPLQQFVNDALNKKYYQLDKSRFDYENQLDEVESSALYPDAPVDISIENQLFLTFDEYFDYIKNFKLNDFLEWVKIQKQILNTSKLKELQKSPKQMLKKKNISTLYEKFLNLQYKSFNEKRKWLRQKWLVTMNDHIYIGNSDPWADNDIVLLEFEEQIDPNLTRLILYKTEPKGRPHVIDMSGINYTAVNNLPYFKDFKLPDKKKSSKLKQQESKLSESQEVEYKEAELDDLYQINESNRELFKYRSSCKLKISKKEQIKLRTNKLLHIQHNNMDNEDKLSVFRVEQIRVVPQLFHGFDVLNFTSFQNMVKQGPLKACYQAQFSYDESGNREQRIVYDPWEQFFDEKNEQVVKYQSQQEQKGGIPVQIQRQKYLRKNVFDKFYVTQISSSDVPKHMIKFQKNQDYIYLDNNLRKQRASQKRRVLKLQQVPGGISIKEYVSHNSNQQIGMGIQTFSEMKQNQPSRDVKISLQGTAIMIGCKGLQIKFQSF